jgi:Na+/H+-translocating membrane pyrophosphatase
MNHLPFILGAYLLAVGGTVGLALWSLIAMRRAEAAAEALRNDR